MEIAAYPAPTSMDGPVSLASDSKPSGQQDDPSLGLAILHPAQGLRGLLQRIGFCHLWSQLAFAIPRKEFAQDIGISSRQAMIIGRELDAHDDRVLEQQRCQTDLRHIG